MRDQKPPSATCRTCGTLIEAQTEPGDEPCPRRDFENRYNDHVIGEHGKPRTRTEAARR